MNVLEQLTVVKYRVGRAAPVVIGDGGRRPPRRVRVVGEHGSVSFGLLALRRVDGQRNRVQARSAASGTRSAPPRPRRPPCRLRHASGALTSSCQRVTVHDRAREGHVEDQDGEGETLDMLVRREHRWWGLVQVGVCAW